LVLRGLEDVPERPADLAERLLVRVDGDRPPLEEVEHAQLVEAERVIRMRVRQQDRVEPLQADREKLLPAVHARVDENLRAIRPLEQARRPQTLVPRILGPADAALAADARDARGGARSEECR